MILILCGFFNKNYYCLKCEQELPEKIFKDSFFFFLFFSFLTWSQIWLIRLVDDPHCVWGFFLFSFLFFSFLLWRDFLTLALKKGAFGYDLYKEFFF
jgi:hypothetical protein